MAAIVGRPCSGGKAETLLLDEITANLDAQTEKEVLQALMRVSENRTVISISHRGECDDRQGNSNLKT